MSSLTQRTLAAAGITREGARVSRYFDVMVLAAVLFTLTAAFHIHSELTVGDWDMWVDWKDRRWWVTATPIVWIMFPAAVQYGFWTHFRLPIGATVCLTGLVLGTWISRMANFHGLDYFPYSLVFPATGIAGALILDTLLLLLRNQFLVAIIGGFSFALVFFPANWPLIAPFHQPVEYLNQLVSVADLTGYSFMRTALPEYLRIIERGTLRTFAGVSTPISAAFSGFVCIFMYVAWWYFGALLASTRFVPNQLAHWMGVRPLDDPKAKPQVLAPPRAAEAGAD
ncbi:MAG TPA: bacterial ammonia monooxygenase, subunit AmoA [Stellaceae bacterium]|nr:bacterial ammonia monooxygenase, subunit AmoA [Stellaceae bacterium]